jgi:hypothetical protein
MEKSRFYAGDKGKPQNHIVDFNEAKPVESHEEKAAQVEFWIAKRIGEDLVKAYPGRQWNVNVDTRNEIIIICLPTLSKKEGYHLHMRRDNLAALLPRCRKAAGEILERFKMSRSKIIDPYDIEQLPRDAQDNAVTADRFDINMKWNGKYGR